MKSHAIGHFPQVRFSYGRKWLFNPILKQRLANRPEERVRLQFVDHLIHQTNISTNRIGFEAPVEAAGSEHKLRADLIIYNRALQPDSVVECKSESIRLTGKTAQQAARYNQSLQAEYVMITNGLDDFWYRLSGGTINSIEAPPYDIQPRGDLRAQPAYWSDRGFLSASLPDDLAVSASRFLDSLFTPYDQQAQIRYLTPPKKLTGNTLDHYYAISAGPGNVSIAISLVAADQNETLFSAILNRNGKLAGLFQFRLTDIQSPPKRRTGRVILPGASRDVAIPGFLEEVIFENKFDTPESLQNNMIKFFD